MTNRVLTLERVRELLLYNQETGQFTWRVSRGGAKAGDLAGPAGSARRGYLRVHIDGRSYTLHRVVWLYVKGEVPAGEIDHIDGDKLNNRIANLRVVDRTKNQQNLRGAHKDNGTGFLGVSFNKKNRSFTAHITLNGSPRYLGSFKSPQEAHNVYLEEKRKHHAGCTI